MHLDGRSKNHDDLSTMGPTQFARYRSDRSTRSPLLAMPLATPAVAGTPRVQHRQLGLEFDVYNLAQVSFVYLATVGV